MINLILAYDEEDEGEDGESGLGYFFEACAKHLLLIIQSYEHESIVLKSNSLSTISVNEAINQFKPSDFIFIAYSHGGEDCLLYDNKTQTYVSLSTNIHLFQNTFFYTWACSCGSKLGPGLINHGCYAFLGYDREVYAGTLEIDTFVDCANYGMICLLGGATIRSAYDKMYEKYTNEIDILVPKDYWVASYLRRNRDAFIYLGDPNAKIMNN